MGEIIEILKEKKLKATPQRLAILNILNGHTHPTIEEIYEEIKKIFPSISLATIYKNINTLKDVDLITELNPGGKLKYDINLKPHFHGVCKNCGKIIDFYDEDLIKECKKTIEKKIDKEVFDLNISVSILCEDCAKA
ncbi:Fur family transcriptional regulator [Nitrosophilus kaiyonis]|uniref:Fur family transcriptional regulator n=1 Tax=Nitrosophilus kaiyonis TaxID=2930200 RepID=UPI00249229FE|nr:Fur family transcriptional regulator [Nitrosophilus kaiyonis]